MGSERFSLTSNEWRKNLRDLGFAVAGAILTAVLAWLTGFGREHSDAYWVPALSSLLTGLIATFNRWQRDATKDSPEVIPEREPANPSDWKMS